MPVPVFDVREVTFRYQQVAALYNLSLTIPSGKRIALMGANGSGKSTLLRLLDGLAFPQKGEVVFCGEPLTELRLQNPDIAYPFRAVGPAFQNPDVQLFSPPFSMKLPLDRCSFSGPRKKFVRPWSKCSR